MTFVELILATIGLALGAGLVLGIVLGAGWLERRAG